MKAILCIALLLCSAFAVQLHSLSQQQKQKIDTFMGKNTWGKIMLSMAELNMMTNGALDPLIDGIKKVIEDLQVKLQAADNDYQQRTGFHNNEVRRLNDEIANANLDIANTEAYLRDVLYVQKQTLEDDIRTLENNIASTQKYIEETTAQRARDHEEHLNKLKESDDAVAAIDECLGLVGQLITGGSFAEVKKARQALVQVQNKLKKSSSVENAFVKALLAITANTEFADQGALNKVAELLNKVRESIVGAKDSFIADENKAQADFEADMKQKNADLVQYNLDLNDRKKSLQNCILNIAANEQFVVQRKYDLGEFTKELASENEAYDIYCKQYEDLVAEFNKELAACQEALDVLTSNEFAQYIMDRADQKVVIDTAKRTTGSVN